MSADPSRDYERYALLTATKRTFEDGFLILAAFPLASIFFPKLSKARALASAAMMDYMRKGGQKTASGLVRKRYEHHVEQ